MEMHGATVKVMSVLYSQNKFAETNVEKTPDICKTSVMETNQKS
jgi:hypothetical protein